MRFSDRFVAATEEYNTYKKHVSNPQFRKSFFLTSLPKTAEITICGLGYYELYINGRNITKGPMAPYRANPNHYLYYDRYDLTESLVVGENVIGILLGNGILNANVDQWDFYLASYRSAPKVALCVELDGTILFDASALKCTESPLTFEEFHSGEYYDARLEQTGWKNAGFDDSNWREVIPAQTPSGEARIPDCDPIGIIDVHRPVKIFKSHHGYIYDFTVNCAGLCKLTIQGARGQEVQLRYGELIRNGELDVSNISYNEYMNCDRYILKGDGEETFLPHFTYHGFRFVEVTGITESQAVPELLTCYEMSSSFEKSADFQCDNADLNALFDATMQSDRANFIYFPTDCPHREKNGWTGDAALSAEQFLIYFNCASSLKEWLRNIFKAQNQEGTIPGIVPTHQWGFAWGNGPAWDLVMFELPYRIYQYTGDVEIVREGREHFLRYLRYLDAKRDEYGLLHYGLGDWCHCQQSQKELAMQLPYTDTMIGKDLCDKAAFLFDLLNDSDASDYARRLSDELKTAFRKQYIRTESHTLKISNQTTQAMAIYYGMFNPDEIPDAYRQLTKLIHVRDNHMDFGVLGNRVIYRVLAEHNDMDLALKMMLNPTYPSFLCWLRQGATTLFEDFTYTEHRMDALTDEDPSVLSLNHHFWGDIAAVFMRHLAGIQTESPTSVRIAPCFVQTLNRVSAYITTPNGRIAVRYKKIDTMVDMTVSVPRGVTAIVTVPKDRNLVFGNLTCKEGENHFLFSLK